MTVEYRSFPVLYVDDERPNLIALQYAFGEMFDISIASSGEEALEMLKERDFAVLLTDQRMPGMTGAELCEKVRYVSPETVRIIITAYADIHSAIDAVNRGQVMHYLAKPFKNEELEDVLRAAIDYVHAQVTIRDLKLRILRGGSSTTARAVQSQISHEMRNYLTAVGNLIEYMGDVISSAQKHIKTDPLHVSDLLVELADSHADAKVAVSTLFSLAERLRGDEATSAPPPAPCDLSRFVDTSVRLARSQLVPGVQIKVVLEGSPLVTVDPAALGQILMNLILNAGQAVTDRGDEGRVTIRVTSIGEKAAIRVSDNGLGMTDEVKERIFDPYFTTRPGGRGHGLAVTKQLVDTYGGRIEVESEAGAGTSLTVLFPLTRL